MLTSGRPYFDDQADPVVSTQRHLEPATERRAMDGGDHRDRAVLHDLLQVGEADGGRRVPAELADVGAGDEGAPGADQHDRRCTVGHRLVESVKDPLGEHAN